MPGFVTHYIFGCENITKIENKHIKESVKKHKAVYALGLQGPDLFFFSPFSFTGKRKRLGSIMHIYNTGEFLENLSIEVEKRRGEERKIALAYFAGFLGHYFLDTNCHPYIYYATGYLDKSEPYIGKHVDFETDIDMLILGRYKNKDVMNFNYSKIVGLNRDEINVVGHILNRACKKSYPDIMTNNIMMMVSIVQYRIAYSQLRDKKGYKSSIIKKIEDRIFGHPKVSPLLVVEDKNSRWRDPLNLDKRKWLNPWDETLQSNYSFIELMEKAGDCYRKILNEVIDDTGSIRYNEVKEKISNNSYHSGLDCSIPS